MLCLPDLMYVGLPDLMYREATEIVQGANFVRAGIYCLVMSIVCWAGCGPVDGGSDKGGRGTEVVETVGVAETIVGAGPREMAGGDVPDLIVGSTVGAEGGVVETACGVALHVPAGAVDAEAQLYARETEETAGDGGFVPVGPFYEIGPPGTQFAVPVTLAIPWDPMALRGEYEAADVHVYTAASVGDSWERLGGTALGDRVYVEVNHLSLFGAGVDTPECVPDCESRKCGTDGCEGSCGECLAGYECADLIIGTGCVANCDELCVDRECGEAGGSGECNCGYCDDFDPCKEAQCVDGVCLFEPLSGEPCFDEDLCTDNEHCEAGECVSEQVECDDGNFCTTDSCDGSTGCLFEANVLPCEEDGDPCTLDLCADGQCGHLAGNDGEPCDDGDDCTANDYCAGGVCGSSEYAPECVPACGDGNCVFGESAEGCPVDCGWCGDGICGIHENGVAGGTCPADCVAACGDGLCQGGENPTVCVMDCGGCGDGFCGLQETPESCSGDCPPACGDGFCAMGEDVLICPADCMPPCGDGLCQNGENPYNCPADCTICGDGICGADETQEECPGDCVAACGNGVCEGGETAGDCAVDCGWCGDGVCGYAEKAASCPADCWTGCGDGLCQGYMGETKASCPVDCTSDKDGDEVADEDDNCPHMFNEGQEDLDGDGKGDPCDLDDDGDGDLDATDCAPGDALVSHLAQESCNGVDDDCSGEIDEGSCDDGNPCTEDTCDPETGCNHPPLDIACSDGDKCSLGDWCVVGACVAGADADCNDHDPCTNDSCIEGQCQSVLVLCDDGNPCTLDFCSPLTGLCDVWPEPQCIGDCNKVGAQAACDDGNICTADLCQAVTGACRYVPLVCGDLDPCTQDSCDSQAGCVHAPKAGCVGCSVDGDCDDFNPCTQDGCSPNGLCVHTSLPDGAPCAGGPGWFCDAAQCTCTADCQGKLCGDDGCGGSCGECPTECGDGACEGDENCYTCCFDCGLCCGDGECQAGFGEDCAVCAADCGLCCGDGSCDEEHGEHCAVCPADCGQCCGNGQCDVEQGESCLNCTSDCGGCCGDGNCVSGHQEMACNCSADCQPLCGDGCCTGSEEHDSCPEDCGEDCGDGQCDADVNEDCYTCSNDCGLCCGDGKCVAEWGESCSTCPADCGFCCGDGKCEGDKGEDCTSCPVDCGQCCGDGACLGAKGEDCKTCPADCGFCCGNDVCDEPFGESCSTCGIDCGQCCGDGDCDVKVGESTCTCPADCGGACGDGCCNLDEDSDSCLADCPVTCPDGLCDGPAGEDCQVCPQDCGVCCGNSVCEAGHGENCLSCPGDCGQCCGNDVCNIGFGEDCQVCPDDCGQCCGNGQCDGPAGEQCSNCPDDCGQCCGNGQCEGAYGENWCVCPADCEARCDDGCCAPTENCADCPEDCDQCCGNGQCEVAFGETCDGCPLDCGICCGNGECDVAFGETCQACPQDCGLCCGDGECQAGHGEDCKTCPGDCGSCCGDGECDAVSAEDCATCPGDCGSCCGNGECEAGLAETCSTCPADCACDDDEPCTDDACVPGGGCQYAFNQSPCDDGLFCTESDTCDGTGTCVAGPPVDCSAWDTECHDGLCNEQLGQCEAQPVEDRPCNADDDGCTAGDKCQQGVCEQGNLVDCSWMDDQCAFGECQSEGPSNPEDYECVSVARDLGVACDDGDACTTNDACDGVGGCAGEAWPCGNCEPGCHRTVAGRDGDAPFADLGDNVVDVVLEAESVVLVQQVQELSYLWVPNSGEDTLSKLDTRTGKELARYRICDNPSRTAADDDGFVWVACRNDGGVARLAALEKDCDDRNGDGVVQTSRDLDETGAIESWEILTQGEDECLLFTAHPGGTSQRALAVDSERNAWVGEWNAKRLRKLGFDDGANLSMIMLDQRPFGLEIDDNGLLWVAARDPGDLVRVDPVSKEVQAFTPPGAVQSVYGITLDANGDVWLSNSHLNGDVFRFRTADEEFDIVTTDFGLGYTSAMTVGNDGVVYVSHHTWTCGAGRHVTSIDVAGMTVTGTLELSPAGVKGPYGVSMDRDGFLWTGNHCANSATKVNVVTGEVVGEYPVGSAPYAYNDFVVSMDVPMADGEGHYTHVFEAAAPGLATWLRLDLDVDFPMGSLAEIRFKKADTEQGLEGAAWYEPLGPFPVDDLPADLTDAGTVAGKYLLVMVTLYPGLSGTTPTLEQITADYESPLDCDNGECGAGEDCLVCPEDCGCQGGLTCVLGSCEEPFAVGEACDKDDWCADGNCVDGVCCEDACDGPCMECGKAGNQGSCVPVADGADPSDDCAQEPVNTCGLDGGCNGSGGCRFWAEGMECQAQSCVLSTLYLADECDGSGACDDLGTSSCDPFACSDAGDDCRDACSLDSHCVDGNYCNVVFCDAKKDNGETCGLNNECMSELCVDGYCCNTLCDGDCQGCNVQGVEGSCTNYGNNLDPEGECSSCQVCNGAGGCKNVSAGSDIKGDCSQSAPSTCGDDGECDGGGSCRLWANTTVCAAQSCTDETLSPADLCSGGGACVDSGTSDCCPYKCDGDSCRSSCTIEEHCCSGNYCGAGECVVKRDNGQACTADIECTSGNCDADVAGTKRCHATETACVQGASGAETTNGTSWCTDQSHWRLCTGSAWGAPQNCTGCQSCQTGSCVDDDLLCTDSGWDQCDSACVKSKSDSGVCAGGVCGTTSAFVSAGTVCEAGAEVLAGAAVYCDMAIDCVTGDCAADRYYRACAGGGVSCADTNRQSAGGWFASASSVITETAYKVGASCTTADDYCQVSAHCSGDDWYGGYTCNGSGGCNVDRTDLGCCNHTDCAVNQYCAAAGHTCEVLPVCAQRSATPFGYDWAPAGTDLFADCSQSSPATCGEDGECDGAGNCRLWDEATVCAAQSCADETLSPADLCSGAGACVDSGTSSCCPFKCSGASCRSSCTGNEHCCAGYTCVGGSCTL